MKLGIVFVIAVLAICGQAELSNEQKEKVMKHYEKCVESTGVDKELIAKARKGNLTEDPKFMTYCSCMMQKLGFQDADGTLHPDIMKANLPVSIDNEKPFAKVIDKCTKIDASLGADKIAYNCFKCIIEMFGKEIL